MTADQHTRKFRVSRTKLQHGYLLAGVLAAIGLVMLALSGPSIPDGQLIGLIPLGLAAIVLISVIRTARDPRPRMVLDSEGVWYRDWGLPVVPWPQVERAHITGSRLLGSISLELRDPDALLAGLDEATRAKIKSNSLVRLPRLMVPNGALDASPNDIVAAIRGGLARAAD